MPQDKERTVLNPSVAAEGEQPLTNHGTSIPDDVGGINNETVKSAGGKKNRLKTVSMTELYSQVYVSRPPIIGGLLYTGTYILAGAPKLGKSFLMAQLAYYVSTGTDMWGFPVQKGAVLYLALEDDYGRLQKRLYKMFGVETAENLHFGIEAPSLGDGLMDMLEGFVEDHPDTRLIIVDTLQKVRGNGDGHTYSSDYQDICQLKRFTDSRDLCLMIVHHTRKQQSEDRFDTISGIGAGTRDHTKQYLCAMHRMPLLRTGLSQAHLYPGLLRTVQRLQAFRRDLSSDSLEHLSRADA